MIGLYCLGALLGGANGLLSAVMAWGRGGRQHRFYIPAAAGGLFGLYEMWLFGDLGQGFWTLLLLWGCLLSASLTDLTKREILPWPMAAYAGLLAIVHLTRLSLPLFLNALLGAAAGAVILGLPRLVRPDAVGRGDILLLAVTGFGAGFPGVIYVLARSLLALAAVSIIQLLRKKLDIHSEMPLAPFLLFGALI